MAETGHRHVANPEGRIPFRIRIGITGHRLLTEDETVVKMVRWQLKRIWGELLDLPERTSTPIRIAIVSALAEGADRLIVREALAEGERRGLGVRLEVLLPMDRIAYAEEQGFTDESLEEFERLLRAAALINELPREHGEHRYKHAGQGIVNRSDVLLAIWNGERTGGEGGSAETLLYAASRWRPCIWISTGSSPNVRDNLTPGTAAAFLNDVFYRACLPRNRAVTGTPGEPEPKGVLKPLVETFDKYRRFNEEKVPRDFQAQLEEKFLTTWDDSAWIASPYLRATLAASRCRRLFTGVTWAMVGLAVLAAASLGASVAFDLGRVAALVELCFLVLLFFVWWALHRSELHKRWLSYRWLAERLRSARYLAPTGVNYSRLVGLRGVLVEGRSADWFERAEQEVWGSRPTLVGGRVGSEGVEPLKQWLAEDWIEGQIDYYKKSAARHESGKKALGRFVGALFLLTVVAVSLHAYEKQLEWMTFLSILLPTAAASTGAILTVRQHHAQAERYRQMEAGLREVKKAVLEADELNLHHVCSEAARLCTEEGGNWLGAMWFLDIEHPL